VCRSDREIPEDVRKKIALFCDVEPEAVVAATDVESVYEVPLVLADQGVDDFVLRTLKIEAPEPQLDRWKAMLERLYKPIGEVSIALVGKYTDYEDSYKSLKEALLHGGIHHGFRVNMDWIDSETMHWPDCVAKLEGYDGVLVPGGFGKRGVEGMLHAIRFARENKVPYFGICLGMQTLVIEFARNVCGLEGANSTEFENAPKHRVIYKLRELLGVDELGGTMRLGAYQCQLAEGSFAREAYGSPEVSERHRHRFEFNREFEPVLTEHGLRITGATADHTYVEICELPDHPWFLGCQFHPEFKSKPLEPHPLFTAFLGAAAKYREVRLSKAEQPLFAE
jgi:CTP synthase